MIPRADEYSAIATFAKSEEFQSLHPQFADFITQVTREVDKLPRLDAKTQALIRLAADVANQDHRGQGSLFNAHLSMALTQGVTRAELEELLTFLCVYAGFNKVAGCLGSLNEFFEKRDRKLMTSALESRKTDYSQRHQKGKVAFYVLLWKRHGISLEMFDNYWKDVHGPVCARLPGQYQYWQYHVAHNNNPQAETSFDGIAELTFESEADRQIWFQAAGILMDDEHNVFRKAIGYNTSPGNSITYVDALPTGAPNRQTEIVKFHVLVQQNQQVSVEAFRQFMQQTLAPEIASHPSVLKFRLHLFEEVDNSRPDADGVVHTEAPEDQYQAAYEIAFANPLEMKKFLGSEQKEKAFQAVDRYVSRIEPFKERSAYTFVYDGAITLAGQRSAKVAQLITDLGAINQVKDDIVSLITHNQLNGTSNSNGQVSATAQFTKPGKSGLGHLLQGVQHVGVTVKDMEQSLKFYTEVLGGKLVVGESELVGDVIQNTLFQKEELDAIAKGIDPKYLDFPNLRSGHSQALDVKFISFGNTVIELILLREAGKPNAQSAVNSIPSHIGHVNAMHISFNVKEGIDLNIFAKLLEEECQKRGLDNVVCNRIIDVKSEAERRAVALQNNSFKFWNEPGLPEVDWSHNPMEGWSLFYCKGPNGEQLEFNQVTRKVKNSFKKGVQEYNQANGTEFDFPEAIITNGNGSTNGATKTPYPDAKALTFSSQLPKGQPKMEALPGVTADMVKRLFSRGEAFDSEGFTTFFTDNPVYQFGNFDICFDKDSIKKSADNFFSQINAVYHEIKMMWEVGDVVFVEMDVHYWRKDNSFICLPCFDVFRIEGDKFSELRIFMDVNPVFDPSIPVADTASVFIESQGKPLYPPGIMKHHFAHHPEGVQRVQTGYPPKWISSGPQWSLNSEAHSSSSPGSSMSQQLEALSKMSELILQEEWDEVKNYLTDDIMYKVGSGEPRYGKDSVVDFLSYLFNDVAKLNGHDVRKVWDEPGIISIEMDALYTRLKDSKKLTIACCDIYRMQGNQVREWRVYADMAPFQED